MITQSTLSSVFLSLRPTQWIKNLSVFAAIIFGGALFQPEPFVHSLVAFIVFSILSSASYLVNDVVDAPLDRLHPSKKFRPIAKGDLQPKTAIAIAIVLMLCGFVLSLTLGGNFFSISLLFVLNQYVYSFFIKKKAVYDILGISFSFIIRALAGEVASGFHLPVWLLFSLIFLALFIASGKRRSELIGHPKSAKTRPSLRRYQKSLLNFYISIFAVSTIISYSLFTFSINPTNIKGSIHLFLLDNYPSLVNRKLMMLTIIPVIFGIMRFGQIIFETSEGEKPEKLVTTDIPLAFSILVWGVVTTLMIYAL